MSRGPSAPSWLVVGWRNLYGRAEVRRRSDYSLLGYVRLSEDRWFAESAHQSPIEGTFKTRGTALDALLDTLPSGGRG